MERCKLKERDPAIGHKVKLKEHALLNIPPRGSIFIRMAKE